LDDAVVVGDVEVVDVGREGPAAEGEALLGAQVEAGELREAERVDVRFLGDTLEEGEGINGVASDAGIEIAGVLIS
jgi:hypothetical protein